MSKTAKAQKSKLEPLFHAPKRLQIVAFLSEVKEAEFSALKTHISVSDSVMSKQLAQLDSAGFIKLRKAPFNGRQRTWVVLTWHGKKALEAHIKALNEIVRRAQNAAAE